MKVNLEKTFRFLSLALIIYVLLMPISFLIMAIINLDISHLVFIILSCLLFTSLSIVYTTVMVKEKYWDMLPAIIILFLLTVTFYYHLEKYLR